MDRRGHVFAAGGRCVWCKVEREKVDDRRAPPFCAEHPQAESLDPEAFQTINSTAGY